MLFVGQLIPRPSVAVIRGRLRKKFPRQYSPGQQISTVFYLTLKELSRRPSTRCGFAPCGARVLGVCMRFPGPSLSSLPSYLRLRSTCADKIMIFTVFFSRRYFCINFISFAVLAIIAASRDPQEIGTSFARYKSCIQEVSIYLQKSNELSSIYDEIIINLNSLR